MNKTQSSIPNFADVGLSPISNSGQLGANEWCAKVEAETGQKNPPGRGKIQFTSNLYLRKMILPTLIFWILVQE